MPWKGDMARFPGGEVEDRGHTARIDDETFLITDCYKCTGRNIHRWRGDECMSLSSYLDGKELMV